jgi:peptidoglycan hydrolase FlgJ
MSVNLVSGASSLDNSRIGGSASVGSRIAGSRLGASKIGGSIAAGRNPATSADPAAVKAELKNEKAARDFEALLLGPVLDSLQKSFAGNEDAHTVGAADYRQMGTQALAQAIAARGGIGIAQLILQHLQPPKVSGDR